MNSSATAEPETLTLLQVWNGGASLHGPNDRGYFHDESEVLAPGGSGTWPGAERVRGSRGLFCAVWSATAAVWGDRRSAGARIRVDRWLLGLARGPVRLGGWTVGAAASQRRTMGARPLGAPRARLSLQPGSLALIICPGFRGSGRRTRSRGRSSEGGTSRWARAGCRQADRIPS